MYIYRENTKSKKIDVILNFDVHSIKNDEYFD